MPITQQLLDKGGGGRNSGGDDSSIDITLATFFFFFLSVQQVFCPYSNSSTPISLGNYPSKSMWFWMNANHSVPHP